MSRLVLKANTLRTLSSIELAAAQGGLPNVSDTETNCWRCASALNFCPVPSIDLECPTTGQSARGCTFD